MAAHPTGAMQRGRVAVPQMPYFEPSTDPSAKATLLSQQVNEHDHFTFPANRDFWNNFVTQLQQYPGAREPPHYHVDASHTRESVLVNKEFLRRFVSGWEKANPHFVSVTAPSGHAKFQSSEDFWSRFVNIAGQRRRARIDRGELDADDTAVTSSLHPNQPPVRTTEADWADICRSWDEQYRNIPTRQYPSGPPAPALGPPPQDTTPRLMVTASPPPTYPPPSHEPALLGADARREDSALLSHPYSPEQSASVSPRTTRRTEMAAQPAHLDHFHQAQGKQIDELQRMLASMSHQANMNKSNTDEAHKRAEQLRV
eukprot:TRINITY_DN7032_c0_g1_i1.p2 TRINITY_DN7032_c0_g1~~TRINITY_DN7032_c0_g1_i1.p2  ORF type:complete len:314 (+),score=91.16 TRINITY_DN7032_c0_g1_i1:46-987(+)